jgi:hypothetical protein
MDTNTHTTSVAAVPVGPAAVLSARDLAALSARLVNNPTTYVDPAVVSRLLATCEQARDALRNIAAAGVVPTSVAMECVRTTALHGLGEEA